MPKKAIWHPFTYILYIRWWCTHLQCHICFKGICSFPIQSFKKQRTSCPDVCVPISRLTECLLGARQDIDASGLQAPIVGHVGDGNFHAMLLYDESDADEVAEQRFWEAIIRKITASAAMTTITRT